MVKKKKSISPEKQNTSDLNDTTDPSVDPQSEPNSSVKSNYPFKSQEWVSTRSSSNSKKTKVWKSLKQILASDKSSAITGISYASLDCKPSRRPAKRYSDLSGLPANYKDPTTQLLYHNLDEFALIKTFSNDIINGYLELRKANIWSKLLFIVYKVFIYEYVLYIFSYNIITGRSLLENYEPIE